MYGYVPISTAAAIPTGAAAVIPGASLMFNVEEDNMTTNCMFNGVITTGSATNVTFYFYVDAASATTLPIYYFSTAAAATNGCSFSLAIPGLTKGMHNLQLWALASASSATVDGTTYDCRVIANRVTADATFGQGVNSKVQLQE
jgi:hypothetical protein